MSAPFSPKKITATEFSVLTDQQNIDINLMLNDQLRSDPPDRREDVRQHALEQILKGKSLKKALWGARAAIAIERRPVGWYSLDQGNDDGSSNGYERVVADEQEEKQLWQTVTFSTATESLLDTLRVTAKELGKMVGAGHLHVRSKQLIAKKNLTKLITDELAGRGAQGQQGIFTAGVEVEGAAPGDVNFGEEEVAKVQPKKRQAAKKTNISKLHLKNDEMEKGWNAGGAGQGGLFGGAV